MERINPLLIYPPLLERLELMLARLEGNRIKYVATAGFRTFAGQDFLYSQGREKPGPRVTNARGGESPHNFGLAVDFVRDLDVDKPGVQPGWDVAMYLPLCTETVRAGLHTGVSYNDSPHVGWPRFQSARELEPLRDVWESLDEGQAILPRLQEVWRYMESISNIVLPEY